MEIINTPFWILEFVKVLLGYVLIQFLWPQFIFARHLRRKSVIYRFSFCVTVQTVLINTVVLGLGLLHILNSWTMYGVFLGTPLIVLYQRLDVTEERVQLFFRILPITRVKLLIKKCFNRLGTFGGRSGRWQAKADLPGTLEYLALGAIALYALVYFSWGSFQNISYGFGDQYVHHSWIYGLTQGQIFSGGVYPAAMHCLIYSIHLLFGVELYSLVLFFGGIQSVIFLLASYCLLRELFRWRYAPILTLAAFMLFGSGTSTEIGGMFRLQNTLPLEFALTFQMLCVLYLIRYLRYIGKLAGRREYSRFHKGNDLFLFTMSLAALLASHFHPAITAFCLCVTALAFHIKKGFSKERFLPLAAAVLCGTLIAIVPMAGGVASGIPMEQSLNWAMGVMAGEDSVEARESRLDDLDALMQKGETSAVGKIGTAVSFGVQTMLQSYEEFLGPRWAALAFILLTAEVFGGILFMLALAIIPDRARSWVRKEGLDQLWFSQYWLLAALFLAVFILYVMPYFGLPELIIGARLVSTLRIFLFASMMIPLDLLFSLLALWTSTAVWNLLSVLCLAGVCLWGSSHENYHGFLFNELTRYPAEAAVMSDIIHNFPQYTYTVVSPTDGLYHSIQYGWHEELLDFVNKAAGQRYFLPSEHVFVFVEKRPLMYAQIRYVNGPSWLGSPENLFEYVYRQWTQAPDILAAEISPEAAQKELQKKPRPFDHYKDIESRTIIESKAYYWCQQFEALYPNEMSIYYDDDDFVCYYFRQNPNSPFDLALPAAD